MAELVLIFCLAGAPTSCQEEHPLLGQMPLTSCLVQAQQYAQEWLSDHPKWALAEWRCERNMPKHQST